MSSTSVAKGLSYPKPSDFVTNSNFEAASIQQRLLTLKISPHIMPTYANNCGQRWEELMEAM